jgi:predicted nucleotidyltransferase
MVTKMLKNYALFKVLKLFMEEPYTQFYLREVAKRAGVGTGTARSCLNWLVNSRFLELEKKGNLFLFKADFKAHVFRHFKLAFNILNIEKSGLPEFLGRLSGIGSAVIYGSFARGENDSKSDLDLLIIGTARNVPEIRIYAKRVGSEINSISFTPAEWRNKAKKDRPFYERVIMDGIALVGEIPVVR